MFRMTRPNLWITLAIAVGTALMGTACSGGSSVETTTVAESNSVAEVAESVISVESTTSETTDLATTAAPVTTAASKERMTVAEAQAIVDQLTQTISDAYGLAKQGDLIAARAKLAEAETGDQLAVGLSVFEEGADLSEVAELPGRPVYQVVRVSDSKGNCTTLAGEYDVSPLFGGSNEFIPTAMFLTNEGGQWKLSFFTESETSSDVLC